MKRFVFLFIGFIFLLQAHATHAADENFFVSVTSNYKVQKDGIMSITNTIEIVNQKTEIYAPTFSFSVRGMKPDNVTAFENGVALPVEVTQNDDQTKFLITFKRAVVGKGARRKFTLNLTDETLIEKNGDVWDIRLPFIEGIQDFLSAKAVLTVPTDFGELASVSVPPKNTNKNVLEFDKEALTHKINAAFGKFQMYQMLLSYEARNDTDREATREVPLPPDTSYQAVNITEIAPLPLSVSPDEDGNWIATYSLKAHTRQSIVVRGSIKVSNDPRTLNKPSAETLVSNTKPQQYWEIDKPEIMQQSKSLTTPEEIYRFVVNHLHYNYDRVSANVTRLGALKSLNTPNDALCSEFTDLFIALARSRGIPAREMNGYAVVSDSHLTPLSLVSDVLHAWPEYWDSSQNRWIAVDPTWESTSGVDYFSKMDTKHITLSIHGVKSNTPTIPLATADAKKAIRFTMEAPLIQEIQEPSVKFEQSHVFSLLNTSFTIKINNITGHALYDQKIELKTPSNKSLLVTTIPVIPPFGEYTHRISIPNGVMGQMLPDMVTFSLNNEIKQEVVDKKVAIASQLAVVFTIILIALCIITLQVRKS